MRHKRLRSCKPSKLPPFWFLRPWFPICRVRWEIKFSTSHDWKPRPLIRSHLIYNSNGSWVWVKVASQLGGRNTTHAHRSIGVADLNSTRPKRQNWDKLGPIKSPWVISVFYSLYTYPDEGLCSDSSKKDLKLQLLFEFYFFQPSFSKASTKLKKIKTNVWHYSLIAVIILKIFWSEQVHLRT